MWNEKIGRDGQIYSFKWALKYDVWSMGEKYLHYTLFSFFKGVDVEVTSELIEDGKIVWNECEKIKKIIHAGKKWFAWRSWNLW